MTLVDWIIMGNYFLMLGVVVWLSLRMRRASYAAGYYTGRTDESKISSIVANMAWVEGKTLSPDEAMQIMAQQVTQNPGIDLPEEWQWDGIDRIALYT